MTVQKTACRLALLALATSPVGCRDRAEAPTTPAETKASETPKGSAGKASPPPPAPSTKGLSVPDERTPAEFATAWAAVRTAPVDQRGQRGLALARSVDNRIFTWTGYAIAGLCIDATRTCALNVFGTSDTPRAAALRGFFPQVGFTAEGWAAIKSGCTGLTACVVTFEGTVKEVVTDPAEPIRLIFGDASARTVRPPKAGDPWFERSEGRAPALVKGKTPALGKAPALGTGAATKARIRLKPKTF